MHKNAIYIGFLSFFCSIIFICIYCGGRNFWRLYRSQHPAPPRPQPILPSYRAANAVELRNVSTTGVIPSQIRHELAKVKVRSVLAGSTPIKECGGT